MESNKIAVLDKNLPLRAYPEEKLNRIILMDFMPYLARLLSLTDEVAADRLEVALPAIKEHCIGMGFKEIKKMFEMYADSKLPIKPIPNYFDRVLLGKIVSTYKQQKPKPKQNKPVMPTEAEKERIMLDGISRIEKEIKETGSIQGSAHHIYDFMVERGQIEFSDVEKKAAFSLAKRMILMDVKNEAFGDYILTKKLKETLSKIESGGNPRQIVVAKTLLIENYFKNKLDKNKQL